MNRAGIIRQRLNDLDTEELSIRPEKRSFDRALDEMTSSDWLNVVTAPDGREMALERRLAEIRNEKRSLNAEYARLPDSMKGDE